jgi:hypothetical protein
MVFRSGYVGGGSIGFRGAILCFMTPVGQSKYKDDIDPTLISYTLSLTPAERLEFHEQQTDLILNSPGLSAGAD